MNGFRRELSLWRAVALVADVRFGDSDAIRVELEHLEGLAISVLVPYKRKRFGRGTDYSPMAVSLGPHNIWSGS